MRLTQELGTASRLFGGSDIDGPCLDANYKSIEETYEVFKRDWKKYGTYSWCIDMDRYDGPFMVY